MYLYHSEEHLCRIRKQGNYCSPHLPGNLSNKPVAVSAGEHSPQPSGQRRTELLGEAAGRAGHQETWRQRDRIPPEFVHNRRGGRVWSSPCFLGFVMPCHVCIPGDTLTALGTEQQVVSVSFSWLSARRAISITGLAFPPGDTGGQQQVTICARFFPAEQGHPSSTFLSPLPQIHVRISQIRI